MFRMCHHLNQCTHGDVWSCTVALFQRSGGGGEWRMTLQASKNALVKCLSLHFQLELNTLEGLNVVTDWKNIYIRRTEFGWTWGLYLENCFADPPPHPLPSFCCVKELLWRLSKNFRYKRERRCVLLYVTMRVLYVGGLLRTWHCLLLILRNLYFFFPHTTYLCVSYDSHMIERLPKSLTLCEPCITFQCVDKPTRCNTSYEWSLLSVNWLYIRGLEF